MASYEAMQRAVAYCRARRGPALVHAHVIRRTLILNPTMRNSIDPLKSWMTKRGAIRRARSGVLISEELASEADIKRIIEEVDDEVNRAADEALAAPKPAKKRNVVCLFTRCRSHFEGVRYHWERLWSAGVSPPLSKTLALLNDARSDQRVSSRRDGPRQRIFVFGEDVADCSASNTWKK